MTISHVLEHLRDPVSAVLQIRDLLGPGGVLIVTGPNTDGRLFRAAVLLRRLGVHALLDDAFYLHNPNMHLFMPSQQSLCSLLSSAGFEILWTEPLDGIDWPRFWRRAHSPAARGALRIFGPLMTLLRFTARDNLAIAARRLEA